MSPQEVSFSVVIPSLGRDTIRRAVGSVVAQQFRPLEIIVVDNGDTPMPDQLKHELIELSAPIELRFASLPPRSGASISRNLGAWLSRGVYVAFLDDDDEFAPAYLSLIYDAILMSDASLLYGERRLSNNRADSSLRVFPGDRPSDEWFVALYRRENPGFGGQNVVALRESFLNLGGFPVEFVAENDTAFAMVALRAGVDIKTVSGAVVLTHTPYGYRLKDRPDRWVDYLRLVIRFWPYVRWGDRFRAARRVFWYALEARGPDRNTMSSE